MAPKKTRVTSGESCYGPGGWQINEDETLIAFYNRTLKKEPLHARLEDSQEPRKLQIDDLEITFKRTIRVPDNGEVSYLPPDSGSFPLYNVADFASVLPQDMVDKGGLFFSMYREYLPARPGIPDPVLICRNRTRSDVGEFSQRK
jgi:hypothetical protein